MVAVGLPEQDKESFRLLSERHKRAESTLELYYNRVEKPDLKSYSCESGRQEGLFLAYHSGRPR